MQSIQSPKKKHWAPVLTLLFLAPFIPEVLFGATRISMWYLLIPQMCIYGSAALIIRALARQRGWSAMLLLGVAYAIAEECVILQTSVSPPYQHLLFGSAPNQNYIGALNINWVYLLWALGYESVWSIIIPIQLTELLFPDQCDEAWISRWGMIFFAILFLIPSYGIWYTFTQVGMLPGLAYEAPFSLILIAQGTIIFLGILALRLASPSRSTQEMSHVAPKPWIAGIVAFLLGLPWFVLAIFPYIVPTSVPVKNLLLISLAWASLSYGIIRFWSVSSIWQDVHRLALIVGALVASMMAGFFINGPTMSPIDLDGKIMLNLLAVILLIHWVCSLQKRKIHLGNS